MAKKLLQEEENEKIRHEAQIEENNERRKRYKEKREAYLAEKKARLDEEQAAKEREAKFLLFSDKHQSAARRLPRAPLTLDAKGGISDELTETSIIPKVSHEVDILVECLEACVEMNLTIEKTAKNLASGDSASASASASEVANAKALKFVKLQRNALLGTLARCMEHLKHLKNGEKFTGTRAQKFRNYLFKSPRFLLTENQNLKQAMELNAEIITMINEIIFCIRTKETETALVHSKLFKELETEAEVFTKENIPTLSFCKQGIERANSELDFYQKCLNEGDSLKTRKMTLRKNLQS